MRYVLEHAWLPDGIAAEVSVEITGGRFRYVGPGDGVRLAGLALPGFANAHSHAFHRALRGRTQDQGGDFWFWRRSMYALAERLDPDSHLMLARAAYAEMALAGITTVGEFHYLHHPPGGTRYDDPNAMGAALRQAAREAGIRLTLLDTCYLTGGLDAQGHRPLAVNPVQRRFCDDTAEAWRTRVESLADDDGCRIGSAIHSVRAVPAADFATVDLPGRPRHVHLSEQPDENAACEAFYGRTPTELLADHGVLGQRTTAVHATHLTPRDVSLLAESGTTVCGCPTTEGDLADGLGPFDLLHAAKVPLSLGSDQHAVIDPLVEARMLEHLARLETRRRGCLRPVDLLAAMTNHASLGWPDAGRIEVGARADLVVVDLESPRTAGCEPDQVMFAATASDIRTVIVDGRVVVADGEHVLGPVGPMLAEAIGQVWA
jgi:formiminoglutamate deiminase